MDSIHKIISRQINDISHKRQAKKLQSDYPYSDVNRFDNSSSQMYKDYPDINFEVKNPCYIYGASMDKNMNLSCSESKSNYEASNPKNTNIITSIISSPKKSHSTSTANQPVFSPRKISNSVIKIFGFNKHEKLTYCNENLNSFSNINEDQTIPFNETLCSKERSSCQPHANLKPITFDESIGEQQNQSKFQKFKKGLNSVDPSKMLNKRKYQKKGLILNEND